MKFVITICLAALCLAAFAEIDPAGSANAQAVPSTDIFVGTIRLVDTGHQIDGIRNLTRRAGYDNQPEFSADGRYLLFNSMREGVTDIFRHDFQTSETTRLTATPVSEYSPGFSPDGGGYSAVMVEADGTQRLWFYSKDGSPVRPLLEHVAPVGYYSWIDSTRVALFVLGDPLTLRIADVRTGLARTVTEHIGRAIKTMPGSNRVTWIDKSDPDQWVIRLYDPDARRHESLIPTLPGVEDLAWTPYGTLLMGLGSVVFEWDPLGSTGWTPIADLAGDGVRNITRIAVSAAGNRIAIVGDHRAN